MSTQRGMSTGIIVAIVAILLVLGGGWYYMQGKNNSDDAAMKTGEAMEEKSGDAMMDSGAEGHSGDAMMEGEAMMEKKDGDVTVETETSFRSAVIAGSSSPLLEFDQRDYEAALDSDRVVVLYFYASWCPLCRAEFIDTEAAFNTLNGDEVVGFRVHFNDGETTSEMTALAREFGVAYQHTKVFIKNGERILKSPETWSKERYLSEFKKVIN